MGYKRPGENKWWSLPGEFFGWDRCCCRDILRHRYCQLRRRFVDCEPDRVVHAVRNLTYTNSPRIAPPVEQAELTGLPGPPSQYGGLAVGP